MTTTNAAQSGVFRIWITNFAGWQPKSWRDMPREATAIELAEPGCFSAADALAYIEGYNSAALARRKRRWAVAVPVVPTYDGDLHPGETIFPRRTALSLCRG